jgi:N-formylglutamate amidohydrolase
MKPVTVREAAGDPGPAVTSLPHSGLWVPEEILQRLNQREM